MQPMRICPIRPIRPMCNRTALLGLAPRNRCGLSRLVPGIIEPFTVIGRTGPTCARSLMKRRSFLRQVAAGAALPMVSQLPARAFGAAAKPRLVFVVGTHHYSPELTMPPLAREMERLGFRTTVVLPPGDPEENKNGAGLPGLEALATADAAVFFLRFLTLGDEQFAHLERFLKSAKPLVGLRTSTHSFRYQEDHPRFCWNEDFGKRVLGTGYLCHMRSETECRVIEQAQRHPILTGVGSTPFVSPGQLYITDLSAGCSPLLLGAGIADREHLVQDRFRTRWIAKTATDIVAWTWQNALGARVFGTTLGHPGDFEVPQIMRLVVNGIHWAVGVAPPAASTEVRRFHVDAKI